MKLVASKNNFTISLAAALVSSVSLLAIERANAACAPDPVANGGSVTCGDTTNQSGNFGFSSDPATGVTITVQSGATVSSTSNPGAGIHTTSGTIVNLGTITGRDSGVRASGGITITNSGAITGTNNVGVLADTGAANVTNAAGAKITGGTIGIDQSGGDAAISNAGQIESLAAANGIAIRASGNIAVDNTGSIDANGQNGIAIQGKNVTVVSNSGTIQGGFGNTGGVAIDARVAGGTTDVTSSGSIQASSIAIATDGLLTLDNTGSISSTGANAVISNNGDVSVNQRVPAGTPTGKISADAPNAVVISAANGTATISNIGDGANTGLISANGANGTAIKAKTVVVTANTGRIQGFNGITGSGIAIDASVTGGTANVTSSGTITAATTAIVTDGLLTLNTAGGVIAGGAFGVISNNGDVSVNQNVAGSTAKITAGLTGGVAISAVNGTATVANFGDGVATGVITGNKFAIDANTVNLKANSGLIEAVSVNGKAINGTTVSVEGNSGSIQALAAGGVAIDATTGAAAVTNGTGTITGTLIAINGNTVTVNGNEGKIEATEAGGIAIAAADATVINGSGRIQANANAVGNVSKAIEAFGVLALTNGSGTVQANGSGGIALFGDPTNAIVAVNNGTGIIQANGGSDPVAGGGFAVTGKLITVTANAGTIEANGADGIAIKATGDADVTNANNIQATGANGIAIQAGGTATVANAATGSITGNANAITAQTINVTSNDGTIEATADAAGGGGSAISGGVVNVTNSGTIRENGAQGHAINANNGAATATVNNLAGGSIIADGTNGIAIASGPANVANAGTIRAANGTAISADGLATVANLSGGTINGGASAILARTLDVSNAIGATITGGANAIQGSGIVRNAGTIQGGTASVAFNGGAGVTNQLVLQTGSQLIGDASGSTAGATNQLIFQGHGTADNNFISFNTLDVQADTAWVWNTTATITGGTTISSGVLAVDGILNSPTMVNAGGALAGRGTLNGDVTVASGGAVAPGAVTPFSTLTVGGNVAFNAGSVYRVNINAAGQNDKLIAGTATLTGGTVSVLAQGGVLLGTPYTILTANGGLGGTQFSGVSGSSGFLKPTLTYDANDVFLTFAGAGTNGTVGFATAALTRNQVAVATALDASPTNNSLVGRLLALTIEGARAAFDALSGEIFGTVQNVQNETASFTRSGVLGRLRQASYADAPGELGALGFAGPELAYAGEAGAGYVGAGTAAYAADANGVPMKAPRGGNSANNNGRDLTFWAQGLGGWGHTDSDGNAASLKSRFGGFLSGADMRFGEMWRAGLVAGYTRTDLNVDDRLSSGGIDSVIVGAYAGGKLGAVNVRGGGTYSYDRIDTSRTIAFPGLTDSTHANFHGSVGQLFGEVGYGFAMGNVALEPFAGLAYVHVQDGSFQESGGLAALSAGSAHENLGYSTLGLRAATIIPLANGTALVPRGSVQWQHAFGDVTPTTGLAFQSTGTAFTVAGLPIARDAALVEGGFDWRLSPWAKLGAFYQGDLAAHAQAHAVKGTFTWDF